MEFAGPSFNKKMGKLYEIQRDICNRSDLTSVLERVLLGSMELTNCDGGTIYKVIEKKYLKFDILINRPLEIHLGGTSGEEIHFQDVPLYSMVDKKPNFQNVCCYAVLKDDIVNIEDAYQQDGFDFSGTEKFDGQIGFHSQSFLTIPLKNYDSEVIGVLQLINSRNSDGIVQKFEEEDVYIIECLATIVSITLSNILLVKNLKDLFKSFVNVLAMAIDEKSPYTGGHCHRVPVIASMIAKSCEEAKSGPFKDFKLSKEQWYELDLAALLHDCGKVTTPVHIVDKATKLETIFDRIVIVETRFNCLKQQIKIKRLEEKIKSPGELPPLVEERYKKILSGLDDDLNFLKRVNIGSEYMSKEDIQRVKSIGEMEWVDNSGVKSRLLNSNEVHNLTVRAGTLTQDERDVINYHIVMTQKMLAQLPYPKGLENIPIIAGSHHERMDGKGYPNGLMAGELPLQARIMCIADVFEALSAKDRPYKKGKKLSECLSIMIDMKNKGHLDPELVDFFIEQEIYLEYAKTNIDKEQIDYIDKEELLGRKKAA